MPHRTLEVPWQRLRPSATILRADGCCERAVVVEQRPDTVTVLYRDGRREQHAPSAAARILLRGV